MKIRDKQTVSWQNSVLYLRELQKIGTSLQPRPLTYNDTDQNDPLCPSDKIGPLLYSCNAIKFSLMQKPQGSFLSMESVKIVGSLITY